MKSFYRKNEFKIALFASAIIFLALVRTLAEPFRLHYLKEGVSYELLKPLLIGALVAATGLFGVTILSVYNKYTGINILALLTVFFLLLVKSIFAIG